MRSRIGSSRLLVGTFLLERVQTLLMLACRYKAVRVLF